MSAAHTPGPWQVNHRDPGQVCDADGELRGCAPIAMLLGNRRERFANARLVASTPTVISALRELHRVCVGMDHPDQMQRPEEAEYLAAVAGAAAALQLVDGQ